MSLGKKLAGTLIGVIALIIIGISFKLEVKKEARSSSLYEILRIQLEEKIVLKNEGQKLYDTP
ncbi:MAG: hypothetical protein ACRCXT_15845 [Paraclostridium sp.]